MGMGGWGQARWAAGDRDVLSAGHSAMAASRQPPWSRHRDRHLLEHKGPRKAKGIASCLSPLGPWGHAWGKRLFPVRSYRPRWGTGTSAIATEGVGGEAPAAERRSDRELFDWGLADEALLPACRPLIAPLETIHSAHGATSVGRDRAVAS